MSTAGRDRSTQSCARCYLMKKKCDKKVPSCSRCTRAQTACLGINRSDRTEIPRSVVRYLESRLAAVKSDRPKNGGVTTSARAANVYSSVIRIAQVALHPLCMSALLQNVQGISYEAKLFYPSERPPLKIAVRGVYQEDPPKRASRGCAFRLSEMGAARIPLEVTKALLNNYVSNILPKYPCFDEADMLDQFNQFYSTRLNPKGTSYDKTCFIVSMVLAISSLTSKAHDFRKVAALSESLQRDAMQHSSFLGESSIRSLQCFLLLIQMALLLPYTANLWYMSGEAMRMAITLGLHQEAESHLRLSLAQTQLRQRIFWTIYQLERTVAIASGCPLAISDEHITTPIPSDTEILEPGQPRHKKWNHFLSLVKLCQLQSEIHGVQFFDQSLPGNTLNHGVWVRKMERNIQAWQASSVSDGSNHDWSINAANHCRLLLYRPCSRNIVPSDASLHAAATIAINMINGYWNLLQVGNLIFSFEYVYHIFQAGMVLLYTLRNHGPEIGDVSLEEQAQGALTLLGQLFDALSARWPVAADTGHYIRELKESILHDIGVGDGRGRSEYDMNLLAELDFMVTQRRIHSVYHRNIEIRTPEERRHLDVQSIISTDSFTPFADELWQEFMETGFQYFADDSLLLFESTEEVQPIQPEDESDTPEVVGNAPSGNLADQISMGNIEMLINSLPACGYCRKQHIKCDREFPTCKICQKTDRECTYYDVVMQKDISRSYIHNLYQRLRAIPQDTTSPLKEPEYPHTPPLQSRGQRDLGCNIVLPMVTDHQTSFLGQYEDWRAINTSFFGRSSSFATLEHAMSITSKYKNMPSSMDQDSVVDAQMPANYPTGCREISLPPISVASNIFHLFSKSVNLFYPTLKAIHLDEIIADMYNHHDATAAHKCSLFYLIIAITSQVARNAATELQFSPKIYFHAATRPGERSRQPMTSNDQLLLLQKTLLVSLYLLFSPGDGDIWRYLGFAIRLYFDLSHRPSENDGMDEELMCMLSRTLYCLECHVAVGFGRPSLLVIGDTLRKGMTKQMSGTFEEYIAISFYRISLLMMQIHSRLLSETSKPSGSTQEDKAATNHATLQEELELWRQNWADKVSTQTLARNGRSDELLEAWASLNFHHTAFLLAQLAPGPQLGSPVSYYCTCERIVESCSFMIRQQQRSFMLGASATRQQFVPVFPHSWVTAHLLFSVGVSLCSQEPQPGTERCDWAGTRRRCLTVLALLESDLAMLSTGFTEVLERLCPD